MLIVCLVLCDSYRCSKLILIHKQAAIGSRALGIPVLHTNIQGYRLIFSIGFAT